MFQLWADGSPDSCVAMVPPLRLDAQTGASVVSLTNRLARIALRGDFPRELVRLLSSLRLDPFGVGGLDADMVAAFAGQKGGGWMRHVCQGPGVTSAESGILCDNAYAAASLLLSRTLRTERPFIVASEPTYAIVREAIQLAANSARTS